MKCPNCQMENSDSAKFCKKCGAPLAKKVINHESMINSMNNTNTSSDNTTKIIIIALVVIAIVLAGAFIYVYGFGNSSSNDSGSSDASADSDVDEKNPSEATANPTPSAPTTSMSILGGSFYTGSAESDKTHAKIYVGTQNAGKSVIVQIFYSRNGNALNHGNMVPATVHSDGYLYITSADAYHYYPDHATIKLYDSNSNLMDTKSVSLSPTTGTQSF